VNHFATVITTNHIDKALAVLHSLNSVNSESAVLHALLVNCDQDTINKLHINNLKLYDLNETVKTSFELSGRIIAEKYAPGSDELRWALKPFFILHLIDKLCQACPVCYVDCDLYFYNDYQFILDKLQTSSIVLTPHWRQIFAYGDDYIHNYRHGLYNAGFVGFNRHAIGALRWWASLCIRECTTSDKANTYTDQRYLDLMPVYFDNVEILRHYGCNVAGWNTRYLKREMKNKEVLISGMPVIFIHFSQVTINMIVDGLDNHLIYHYRQYETALDEARQKLMRRNLPNCISSNQQLY
jgi:hypothetical protein